MEFRVHNLKIAGGRDVPGADSAFALDIEAHLSGAVRLGPYPDALDVEEEFHHLFFDARHGCVFVDHSVYLDTSDGAAVGGTEQYPPKRVANSQTEPAGQRLNSHLPVGVF